MRLDRFICKSTELTKAEAIMQIHAGTVQVMNPLNSAANTNTILDESFQVHENNSVLIHGKCLRLRPFRYILMHKPRHTLCSNADEGYPSLFNQLIVDRVSELHIAGRLDADTTGMVLITDDGRWTYNITRPSKQCKKVYRVGLAYGIADDAGDALISKFAQGIQLQGESQLTLPASLEILAKQEVLLTITQGKYHQVKRMLAAVGNRVLTLHREKIGEVQLDVELGQWRYLTASEVQSFY